MKLRTQLLLVSLFILVLPWAGCQYIREMEQVFMDSQSRELIGRGKAIAAHLQSQSNSILTSSPNLNYQQQLYFHRLNNPPTLDGRPTDDWPLPPLGFDDWQLPTIEPRAFTSTNNELKMGLLGALYQDDAYFYASVIDSDPELHNPQAATVASADHIVLRMANNPNSITTYYLRATSQGPFSARYVNSEGHIRQEHRIRGFWRPTAQGYQIEFIIPQSVLLESIDIQYKKANGNSVGIAPNINTPLPWVTTNSNIQAITALYDDFETRIEVINQQGWLLAQSGRVREIETNGNWFLGNLYQLALNNTVLPALDIPYRQGRMDSEEIYQALSGKTQTQWYERNNQRIARAAIPIQRYGNIVGAVAVTQSTESLTADTNAAFNRLFYYLIIAIAALAFGLLAYASLLSFRIRRLSKAADHAITDDGKIKPDFIRAGFNDEIGDLTRSYGNLLSRLHDYTDYLRTLASKLSHELRTPLAVVRSSLENLEHESSPEDASQYRQRAKEGAERLANLLSAMSSASRMEDSIGNTPKEDFSLDALLTEVGEAYRSAYKNNNIVLDIAKEADFSMHGSPDLIVQMLDKLIDNAVDFCPPKGEIRITLNRTKNSLLLSVSNTGPLLPEHMQGQLFDSLVSVRESQTNNKTHLGLGLYIVRLVVDFHGGQVQGRNMDNKNGVSFDIRLPALNVD